MKPPLEIYLDYIGYDAVLVIRDADGDRVTEDEINYTFSQKDAEIERLKEALISLSNGSSGLCWCSKGTGYDGENCTDESCVEARSAIRA